jgi:solute carrier family 25 citrate transporter 1
LRGFYRGLGPVISTIVPKMAVRFSAFHQLREVVERTAGKSNFLTSLLSGMGAGAIEAVVVVTPSEVVKIRQQEKGNQSRSQIATLKRLLKEGGVSSLYRGLGATVVKGRFGFIICDFYFSDSCGKLDSRGLNLRFFISLRIC